MPRRSPPPAEEAPFTPAEPWWRQSHRARAGQRGPQTGPGRFEIAAPTIGEAAPASAAAGARIFGSALVAVVLGLALLGGLAALVTTDWLAVYRSSTEVRGAQRISADEIYAASEMEGVNIFQVHPARVAARIKQLPGIAEVAVHPRLPYYVTITVREETPFVVWQGITTTTWLAESGAVAPAAGAPPPLKLIDPTGAARQGGKMRPQVLADLKALQAAGLETNEVYYGVHEGFYFRTGDGWTVYLGNGGAMGVKLAALREIKRSSVAANAPRRIIDLRSDGRAQIK